jgi:hypothetical protein
MSGYYRQPKPAGGKRQPGKIWMNLEPAANPRKQNPSHDAERALLKRYEGAWESLGSL